MQKIPVKDKKITNFWILLSSKKTKIGQKRKTFYDIIDEVKIIGLQPFDKYDKSNLVDVSIRDSEVNTYYRGFRVINIVW